MTIRIAAISRPSRRTTRSPDTQFASLPSMDGGGLVERKRSDRMPGAWLIQRGDRLRFRKSRGRSPCLLTTTRAADSCRSLSIRC
jgi:hypothetical protein